MTYTRIRDLREYNFWTQKYVASMLNPYLKQSSLKLIDANL